MPRTICVEVKLVIDGAVTRARVVDTTVAVALTDAPVLALKLAVTGPQKFVPLTVTCEPAEAGDGLSPLTVGVPHHENDWLEVAVPDSVVTETVPWAFAALAGVTATSRFVDVTLKEAADELPIRTSVTPEKFEPVTETRVPPATGPLCGLIEEICGDPVLGV